MRHPVSVVGPVKVWDLFVRLFHWSLVSCVMLDLFVLEEGEEAHRYVGYAALGLVLARIVWGFVGSPHARFSSFFPTPGRLAAHLRELKEGPRRFHPGHNPAGAVMMLTLMALVVALGVTGWLQGMDRFWGEEWLEALHEALANALLGLVALHVLAAVVMGRLERTNLIRAMITGVKIRR